MDPRHPELAISRMDELMTQFKKILALLQTETSSNRLGEHERQGSLVVQEICLVAPRLHEAMMQKSLQRRHDLARGVLVEPQDTAVELPTPPNQAETVIVEPKPRKKATKKPTKKATK